MGPKTQHTGGQRFYHIGDASVVGSHVSKCAAGYDGVAAARFTSLRCRYIRHQHNFRNCCTWYEWYVSYARMARFKRSRFAEAKNRAALEVHASPPSPDGLVLEDHAAFTMPVSPTPPNLSLG